MSHWNVEAWDISEKALKVAKENAERLGAKINFVQKDVLNLSKVNPAKWDIIVSNPPYIAEKEKIDLESHVLDYEPSIALFVSDSDPICFYRAIAVYGVDALKSGGKLYFEINPIYVSDIKNMLKSLKYQHVIIQEDQFGKQRYCYATKV
jgi:release factor glutamine methyltransferase